MRRANDDLNDGPGQDSFLDVVTNIVGIMILLIMVMGVRASRHALMPSAPSAAGDTAADPKLLEEQLAEVYRTAQSTQHDVARVITNAVAVRGETLVRQQQRHALATFLAAVDQELDERRQQLSTQQQRTLDLRCQLADARKELDDLSTEQIGLMSQTDDVEVIENQPTPLAQPANGQEIFLQLSAGHVAVLPVAKLFEAFVREARSNMWRLKTEDGIKGAVGPIDEFRMLYVVRKKIIRVAHRGGFETETTTPDFECHVVATTSPLGEPVDQAVLPDSELRRYLKDHPTTTTVVRIGIYPDSANEYRQLRRELSAAGYVIDETLLEAGQPFGFSPHGRRAYVQ